MARVELLSSLVSDQQSRLLKLLKALVGQALHNFENIVRIFGIMKELIFDERDGLREGRRETKREEADSEIETI